MLKQPQENISVSKGIELLKEHGGVLVNENGDGKRDFRLRLDEKGELYTGNDNLQILSIARLFKGNDWHWKEILQFVSELNFLEAIEMLKEKGGFISVENNDYYYFLSENVIVTVYGEKEQLLRPVYDNLIAKWVWSSHSPTIIGE